ncbi:hypothetical protein BsWGS_15914 [Bradybaena similaris]
MEVEILIGQNDTKMGGTETVIGQNDTEVGGTEILIGQNDRKVVGTEILIGCNDTKMGGTETVIGQNDTEVGGTEIFIVQNDRKVVGTEILIGENDAKVVRTETLIGQNDTGGEDDLKANARAETFPKDPQQSMEEPEAKPLSKKAVKRLARAEKHKEYKRRKREESLQTIQRDDIGYSLEDLDKSSYYFENGVRKVYPYPYVFATHAKGRWVGRKLEEVLQQEFGYDHPDDLMKSFESGLIHVNGKRVGLNHIIRGNDYICHRTHRHENPVTAAPLEVIENNDDILVINKPSSIPCHPCGRYRFNSVAFILGKEMGLTSLRGIYRLDRLTSGVLIFCKTPQMTKTLMSQVANRQVQKEYVCRVVGKFPDGTVNVDQPLEALSNKLRLQVVSPTGKSSQTTFTRISYNGKSSVVRCVPHTGRTHQIRVHLQYLGYPILNDGFYNSDAWGPSRGKNGVYELPYDQVCERILAEHQEKLWDGGENPLYEVKLRELKLREQKNETSVDPNQLSAGSGPAGSTDLSDSSVANVVSNSATVELLTDDEELLECPVTNILPQAGPNIPSGIGIAPVDEASDLHLSKSTGSQISSEQLVHESQPKDEAVVDSGVSAVAGCTQPLPGFEMSKWMIDPSCDQCKKLLIDPQEKQLVMFLHAIRYKGLGWEYETALPDWASEDWSREEDFLLDSPGCPKSS